MSQSERAPETIVRIDGAEAVSARVLSAEMATGGKRLDSATFELLLPGKQKESSEFLDLDFARFTQNEVFITLKPDVGPEIPIHWGKTAGYSIRHDASGEYFQIVSRQEQHHFGKPLKAVPIRLHGGVVIETPAPCIFNEEIDGKVFNNRSSKRDIKDRPIFLDPESARSANALAYQGVTAEPWTLPQAAEFLCEWLNDETYIRNPTIAHLEKILPSDNKLLRNHPIRYGLHLPGALDELLEPYGFSWFVKLIGKERHIRIFRRGSGTARTFKMQRPGEEVDMRKTNVQAANIGFDVTSRAVNKATVIGDYEHFEATWELMPAWDATYDSQDVDDLAHNADAWATTPALSRVWRDWVLNEAGDYKRAGFNRCQNLDYLFGRRASYEHRRKFLPCITLGADGAPVGQVGGIVVEWYDGTNWHPLDEIGTEARHVRILERECGIRFDGAVVPYELMDQGINGLYGARVRVTATIASDVRVKATAKGAKSFIADEKELVLELPSRFKRRVVSEFSNHSAAVRAGTLKTSEVDDRAAAATLCEEIIANWNQASIDGNVTLTGTGIDAQIVLGEPMQGVTPRNVKFSTDVAGTKFPSVVGIRYDFMEQTTTITLDTFAREVGTL